MSTDVFTSWVITGFNIYGIQGFYRDSGRDLDYAASPIPFYQFC